MNRILATMLVGSGLAAGSLWESWPQPATPLHADGCSVLIDSDDDFLPDVVEWAVFTNAHNPDTDGDGQPDFVEVVQYGSPRQPSPPRPLDHEMRVVITAPPTTASCADPAWLHLLFRFVGPTTLLSEFQTWLELPQMPGIQLPIDFLATSGADFAQRQTANDGLWVRVSVPLVSEQLLRTILPCSIHARAVIGGRPVLTGVKLFDLQGAACTLTPFNSNRNQLAVRALAAPANAPLAPGPGSNKVCLLTLEHAGSGPGGSVYEVVDASCEDCNELECGPSCPQSIGWVLTIPGGIESLVGR